MNLITLNFTFSYWKIVIIGLFLTIVIGFILWLICSYYILKWFKQNIDRDYICFNEYNTDCNKVLDKYGDYPIKHIYLVRQPITSLAKIVMNIITFNKFEREMKKYINTTKNKVFFPHHTSIIVEIELSNKIRKSILVEKNNCIKLALDFRISDRQDTRKIAISKKKYTLKNILEQTRERIGNDVFFNWQICRNNCQMLIKEILITLNQFTDKNKNFMFQNEFAQQIRFSEFSLHIINSIANLCNSIESLVGKTLYF